jgi:hypothetical protein
MSARSAENHSQWIIENLVDQVQMEDRPADTERSFSAEGVGAHSTVEKKIHKKPIRLHRNQGLAFYVMGIY